MFIAEPGIYRTRNDEEAEVYELRSAYSLGLIRPEDGTQRTGIWTVVDGRKMGGPQEDDLVEYTGPGEQDESVN